MGTNEKTKSKFTYAGRVITTKNDLGYMWYDHEGKERIWIKRNITPFATIGQIYAVEWASLGEKGGISVTTSGANAPQYDSIDPDNDKVVQWSALDVAARTQYEMIARAKREKAPNFKDVLAPIKAAMRQTNPAGRSAIVAAVILELDRYWDSQR